MNTFQTIVHRFRWKPLPDVDGLSGKIKLLKILIYSEFRVRPAWGWPPEGVEREGKPAATLMKMWPVRPCQKPSLSHSL